MAFFLRLKPPALPLLALGLALACGPKLDNDDGGDDSSGAGTTTTGEAVTSSDSDPTNPSTASSPSSGSDTASGTATAASTTGVATTDDPGTTTATATSTSATTVATSDTSEPPPVEPPVPCEGQATPLTGVETLAYLKSQIPPDPNPNPTGTGSTGGSEPDPGTLYVRLSDQAPLCAEPNKSPGCGLHWEVTIAIPPEFQSPGLFNLLGQDVTGSASETGPDRGDECSFGGGSFPATFEIVAIDDDTITGRLCHVESFLSVDVDLEGSFVAQRCP
jgi:hypothetical protein